MYKLFSFMVLFSLLLPTTVHARINACDRHGSGWIFQLNDYVLSSFKVIKRSDEVDRNHTCSEKWNRDKIVKDEYALRGLADSEGASFRVGGDMCSKQPTLILDYNNHMTINEMNRSSKYIWQHAPYDFYVSWRGDPTRRGALNKVEKALIEFTAILKVQCNKLPDSVRVVGRDNYSLNRTNPNKYEYDEFYSGTFYPNAEKITLIHDDQKTAKLYEQYANNRAVSLDQQKMLKEQRLREGAAVFLMMVTGAHVESSCNDPDIPPLEKPWDCRP